MTSSEVVPSWLGRSLIRPKTWPSRAIASLSFVRRAWKVTLGRTDPSDTSSSCQRIVTSRASLAGKIRCSDPVRGSAASFKRAYRVLHFGTPGGFSDGWQSSSAWLSGRVVKMFGSLGTGPQVSQKARMRRIDSKASSLYTVVPERREDRSTSRRRTVSARTRSLVRETASLRHPSMASVVTSTRRRTNSRVSWFHLLGAPSIAERTSSAAIQATDRTAKDSASNRRRASRFAGRNVPRRLLNKTRASRR
jgi:hypothetical protein